MRDLFGLLLFLHVLLSDCDVYYDDLEWPEEGIGVRSKDIIPYADEPDDVVISTAYRPPIRPSYAERALVSIRTNRPTEFFGDNHFCAGAVLALKIIVTAAHCLVDSHNIETRPRRLLIVAATPNRLHRTRFSVEMTVSDIIIHPKYKRNKHHDIALLNLQDEFPFANQYIRELRVKQLRPQPGLKCTTVGWGQLFYMGPYAADSVTIDLEILDDSKCQRRDGSKMPLSSLCVGDWETPGTTTCRGEAGAPLICENYIFSGIVSWGKPCGNGNISSVFTDASYHRDWIYAHMDAVGRIDVSIGLIYASLLVVNFF